MYSEPMQLNPTLRILIQLFLGITFIFYGVVKLLGGQFRYEDFILDSRSIDGPTLVWSFYGYSPVYGRLIGVAEILPGMLLLIPRTRTIGALLLLPLAANIAVMDFCFAFPAVKYFALLLTLLTLLLLAGDAEKLRLLLRLALADDRTLQECRPGRRAERQPALPPAETAAAGPHGTRFPSRKRKRGHASFSLGNGR